MGRRKKANAKSYQPIERATRYKGGVTTCRGCACEIKTGQKIGRWCCDCYRKMAAEKYHRNKGTNNGGRFAFF